MIAKTRRIAAVAGAVVALAAAFPASASAAPAPCRAAAAMLNGNRIEVVIEGHYVARPTDQVTLTCSVVQYGSVVASATSPISTGVAVVADAVSVQIAPFSVCHTVVIWDITGWGYRYETNCP
ncbi:MAG TPA: hypothetical protein VHJ76_01025 [Actinomycetota bacterium]|nr:hypothetical protein [Actinomycetota bacterium]